MRILFSLALFVGSLVLMTIACSFVWEHFVTDRLYNCTDAVGFDFFLPGDWAHNPVAFVDKVVAGRPMSEPDTIKKGWSITGLWLLWCSFVTGSLLVSFFLARLSWSPSRKPR